MSSLNPNELAALEFDWPFWARPNQLAPAGDWRSWLLLAGRGFGKTRTGAEWVRSITPSRGRIALVAPTAADVRDVIVEGESGILAISPRWNRPVYEPSKRRLTWPNGAMATCYSADEPERLRGPQHDAAWCLAGDTLVLMGDGTEKELSSIHAGEMVQTRAGPKKVIASGLTRRNADVCRLKSMGRRDIVGTADHPIWIDGKGFTPLGQLSQGMLLCATNVSSSTGRFGIAGQVAITNIKHCCTERFTSKQTEQCHPGITCITSTKTKQIIACPTFNYLRMRSIAAFIVGKNWLLTKERQLETLKQRLPALVRSGLFQPLCVLGVKLNSIVQLCGLVVSAQVNASTKLVLALSQDRLALARGAPMFSPLKNGWGFIAVKSATREPAPQGRGIELRNPWRAQTAMQASSAPALTLDFATMHAPSLSTLEIVSVERLAKSQDVYDIAVEGAREFFANGILVHNCDELATWRYPEAWDMLMFGLRLGDDPRCCVTTTPKPIKLIRDLLQDATTAVVRGSTYDNKANLADAFMAQIVRKYEGTRLGRQELNAEMLEDVLGALWARKDIDDSRVLVAPESMQRIVVAVDPATTSGEDSDETGIVVAGLGVDGYGYVLADLTCKETPQRWAEIAVKAYTDFKADRIIAEDNQGGDMVENTVRTVMRGVSYKGVHAFHGKVLRAEPVSALYEQHRIRHVGSLPQLEDQMCGFTADFDKKKAGYSPDRVDALVHALTELMVLPEAPEAAFGRMAMRR